MVDGAGASVQLRQRLVHHLQQAGFLESPRVADAFLAVPREVFLADTLAREGLAAVYRDDAIVTRRDPETHAPVSSSSQPAIMAIMLEMLDVQPGHRVLEVGAGTGYNAAILDSLAGPDGVVLTMDIDVETTLGAAAALRTAGSRAHAVVGDGAVGLPGLRHRPVDRIMITASTAVVPQAWHDQLSPGGRLVVPLRLSAELERAHAVAWLARTPDGFISIAVSPGGFMPLRRPDGSTLTAARPGRGGGQSPFAQVSRTDMDRLHIEVSYGDEPPPLRWRFRRGDHWIGVDLDSPL